MEEVDHAEKEFLQQSIRHLYDPFDGEMDHIHVLRDEHAADLVHLIVDGDGDEADCGVAFRLFSNFFGEDGQPRQPVDLLLECEASFGFGVTRVSCLTKPLMSFAHEIGHNLGLSHDYCNERNATFPDSHGHRNCGGNGVAFRTIMSYRCNTCLECEQCEVIEEDYDSDTDAPVIPYFSNPNIIYGGQPIGRQTAALIHQMHGYGKIISGDHSELVGTDNARTLSITKLFVANFRNSYFNQTLDMRNSSICLSPNFTWPPSTVDCWLPFSDKVLPLSPLNCYEYSYVFLFGCFLAIVALWLIFHQRRLCRNN